MQEACRSAFSDAPRAVDDDEFHERNVQKMCWESKKIVLHSLYMPEKTQHEERDLKVAIERAHQDYMDSIKATKRLPRIFLDGVVRGLGMAIGGTIIFAIAIYLLSQLLWPGAQRWIDERISEVQSAAEQFGS